MGLSKVVEVFRGAPMTSLKIMRQSRTGSSPQWVNIFGTYLLVERVALVEPGVPTIVSVGLRFVSTPRGEGEERAPVDTIGANDSVVPQASVVEGAAGPPALSQG